MTSPDSDPAIDYETAKAALETAIENLLKALAPIEQPSTIGRWLLLAERDHLDGESTLHLDASTTSYVDRNGMIATARDIHTSSHRWADDDEDE